MKGQWYPGRVSRIRSDGSYDVDYDDGAKEYRVQARLVRGRDRAAESPAPEVRVGDRVEGNHRGLGRWYPGKVGRVHSDGTYTVDYDDGEQERRIDAAMVRAIGGAAPGSPKKHKMREGDRVEANYRGRGKWFKGKIDREHYDGTYDRLSLRRETCVPPLVVLKVRSLRR